MQEDDRLLAQLRTTLLATRSAAARRGEHREDAGGMAEAHRRRVAAEAELRRRGPRLASFWGIAPATCQDLERYLRLYPGTAVLHYFAAEERVLIFVTTVDGTRTAYVNTSRKSLHRDIKRYRELIALQGRGALTNQIDPSHAGALLRELAHRLYELLIAPVKDLVPPEARLCIIPHGPLHYLPFGTLCSKSGALLLEERDVFYAVSLSVFDWCHSQGENRRGDDRQGIGGRDRNLVAFANPALAERQWDLPMAEEQARSLAGHRPGARLFVGPEATREAFWREAPGADILALDLHNTFDATRPLDSALRFAAAGEVGGEVTIGES
jgi:CHAT domain-containing protein